jgi:hypothetical protein
MSARSKDSRETTDFANTTDGHGLSAQVRRIRENPRFLPLSWSLQTGQGYNHPHVP